MTDTRVSVGVGSCVPRIPIQMAPTRVHVGVAHSSFPLSGPVCGRLE